MSRDLFEQETVERFGQFSGSQVPEPGVWTGFAEGTGKLALAGLAKTGRAMDLLQSLPAITKDFLKGGTEEQDKFFAMHDFRWNRLVDSLTPGPADVGAAAQVLGGVLGTLPQIILNPPLGIGSAVLSTGEDLVREGVPAWRANLVGMVQGATLAAGIRMPILGENLLQRMVIGGAAANVGLGMANRLISGAILHGQPAAEQFKTFDTTSILTDTLMGLAFGAYAHMSPEMRAQGGAALKELSDWAQRMKPSEIDALVTLRQAQHSNVDSMPGKPLDPTDVEAHVNRLKTAIGQLVRDEPVHVEDMPAPKFEPDLPKEAERVRMMNELVDAAEEIRKQEGLTDPRLELEEVPRETLRPEGETSTAPPESDAGIPPPLGEGSQAGAVQLTIADRQMRTLLEQMAANEAGWLSAGKPGATGFTEWVPKAEWWRGRPDKLNEAQVREAVRKALAGEPLTKAEQRTVDYMVEAANKKLTPSDAITPEDIELVTQASAIDAAAVEQAGREHANDPAAFINEMKRIVDETGEASSEKDSGKTEAETEDPQARVLTQEADRFVLEHPDQLIDVGTDAAGNPVKVSASQYLADARAAAARAREDIPLFEVAAGCLMGKS